MAMRPVPSVVSSDKEAGSVASDERNTLFSSLVPYRTLILAVSGGADSAALLHLAAGWRESEPGSPDLLVATVDHGLRDGSADEAAWVGVRSAHYGLPHRILVWQGPKPTTGLQEAARQARYGLLAGLADDCEEAAIVTAHHADDQAETFVMRLMRGSGVDGLAGIARSTRWRGTPVERPLLSLSHRRLTATLEHAGLDWLEDPSNEMPAFERVRVRKALATMNKVGLTAAMVALSADRLGRARRALDAAADDLARAALHMDEAGFCSIDRGPFLSAPREISLRLLARVLVAVGGGGQPVRLQRLESLYERLRAEGSVQTLGGCVVRDFDDRISIFREPGRRGLEERTLAPGQSACWDGRFEISLAASEVEPVHVRALGPDGLRKLAKTSENLRPVPKFAAAAIPAFWRGESLIAVPQIGYFVHTECGSDSGAAPCRSRFINNAVVAKGASGLANGLHDPIF